MIEPADHRLGERLSDLVLVGVLDDPLTARRGKRIGHLCHEAIGPPEVDDFAEPIEEDVAKAGRVPAPVATTLAGDGLEDASEITSTEQRCFGVTSRLKRRRSQRGMP